MYARKQRLQLCVLCGLHAGKELAALPAIPRRKKKLAQGLPVEKKIGFTFFSF
jgi:hypothetical protein